MTIKTYYCNIENAGDQLTKVILKELWGIEITYAPPWNSDLIGIGSILEKICIVPGASTKHRIKARVKKILVGKPCCVWSSGFRCWNGVEPVKMYRRNIIFKAVRGRLTKEIIERIHTPQPDIVLADGGLLSSFLIKEVQKKHAIGLVPHYTELENQHVFKLLDSRKDMKLIDIRKEPVGVVREIASCEAILSSSLHGLIIADSFGIPNLHISVSSVAKEQAFKYKDYYSSYDSDHISVDLQQDGNYYPTLNQIIDGYKINYNDVLKKQNKLMECFPFQQRG